MLSPAITHTSPSRSGKPAVAPAASALGASWAVAGWAVVANRTNKNSTAGRIRCLTAFLRVSSRVPGQAASEAAAAACAARRLLYPDVGPGTIPPADPRQH